MGVRTWEAPEEPPPPPRGPSPVAAVALALFVLLLLVSNGRPAGTPETARAERLAASLAEGRRPDPARGQKPLASPFLSVLAAPIFLAARTAFSLDENGAALAGKLAAALLSALAAGVLFLAVGLRHPEDEAGKAALVFALGSGVWSVSQALRPQPAAILFLALALLWALKAEHEPTWAGRAGLPVALAVAAHPPSAPLAATLALGLGGRWPRRIPALALWALPGAGVLLYQITYMEGPLFPALGRPEEPWGQGHLGLLLSPAKGLLVFAPVALVAAVGLARAFRHGERWLAGTVGAGLLAHWLFLGLWTGWPGDESWGPLLMADGLPLLLFFLPEGLEVLGRAGAVLVAVSIGVQGLGAFAYDHRWDRLHEGEGRRALWDVLGSPIALHVSERVLLPSLPAVKDHKVMIREHRLVLFGPTGSRVAFAGSKPKLTGAEPTVGDVHLLGGARGAEGRVGLTAPGDGVFLRVLAGARMRRLELRIVGRGRGRLDVGERTFWSEPRLRSYGISGTFRIRHAYDFPESGGPDLIMTLGGGGGEAEIESIALVAPGSPGDPIETP